MMTEKAKILSLNRLDEAAHPKTVVTQSHLVMRRGEVLMLAYIVLLIVFPLQL
jgi:hypothetical protein